ncbi:winged helix-turn-helix transcriptional regulator [Woodsholea maritima]|uniref:winged helix-turn-helix transcriptional regulator n=1 Tax=Woodsholea maritima TaxID=240237 RepID=UPI000380BA84|nr:helix-turn-helix domain-containing protein [Woodsholea maritima]
MNDLSNCRSDCLIEYFVSNFGDRWSLIVLRDLMMGRKRRYCELLEGEEQIATNILADRLKRLEAAGFIVKSRDPENKRSFMYTPTQKALDLCEVYTAIMRWASRHVPASRVDEKLYDRLKDDPHGFTADLMARCGEPDCCDSDDPSLTSKAS